jgi:GntR family transcriptional regulator
MVIERPKSLAEQIEAILKNKIRGGEFAPGSRLPSESELAEQFGVSRATVRTVMAILETQHLITRRQGDGTYINKRVMEIDTRMGDEWDFKYLIEDSGRVALIQPLLIELRPADEQELEALEIDENETVLSIERLFLADEQPVIYSKNVIPKRIIKHPAPYNVDQPIRQILRQYCQIEIAYSISDISACLPTPAVETALLLEAGKPLLKFKDIFYNDQDEPVVFGLNYYNDKALRMRVSRTWG